MPYLLVVGAKLACDHGGTSRVNEAGQTFVSIGGDLVLVEDDPGGETIGGCPNVGATIKPCIFTLKETDGDSEFIRIDKKPVCLDKVVGPTDGTPPGMVKYRVRSPGQKFVSEES